MLGSTAVVGWVTPDGGIRASVRHLEDRDVEGVVQLSSPSLSRVNGSEVDGWTTLQFTTQRTWTDAGTLANSTDTQMVFAYSQNGSDALDYHGHTRGVFTVDLVNGRQHTQPADDTAPASQYQFSTSLLNNAMTAHWNVDENAGMLHMRLESTKGGWCGFGFGVSMRQVDIIACRQVGDVVLVGDFWTEDFQPKEDEVWGGTSSLSNAGGAVVDGQLECWFSRPLQSDDPWDRSIVADGVTDVTFAHADHTQWEQHRAGDMGMLRVNLAQGTVSSASISGVLLFHGLLMFSLWGVLYPSGAYVVYYLKTKVNWLYWHEKLMTAGAIGCVLLALVALVNTGGQFASTHSKMGFAVAMCLPPQMFFGYLTRWGLRNSAHKSWHRFLRIMHGSLGWTLLCMAPAVLHLGLGELLNTEWTPDRAWRWQAALIVWWVLLVVGFVATSVVVTLRERKFKTWTRVDTDPSSTPTSDGPVSPTLQRAKTIMQNTSRGDSSGLPAITWQDTSSAERDPTTGQARLVPGIHTRVSSGSMWIVISDVVYDVRHWIIKHPGGQRVLHDYIGVDATEAFLGNDSSDKPVDGKRRQSKLKQFDHTHSAMAWQKLQSMAVARVVSSLLGDMPLSRQSTGGIRDTEPVVDADTDGGGVELATMNCKAKLHSEQYTTYHLSHPPAMLTHKHSHPILLYCFSRPVSGPAFPFSPGNYVMVQLHTKKGQFVERPFTPIPPSFLPPSLQHEHDGDHLLLCFAIRMHPRGLMSRQLADFMPGYVAKVRGPFGDPFPLTHEDGGAFRSIAMVCLGTGLTPMLQILNFTLNNADFAHTKLSLVYCFRPNDAAFSEVLQRLESEHADVLRLTMHESSGTSGHSEVMCPPAALLRESVGRVEGDFRCFVCGPRAFMQRVSDMGDDLGWADDEMQFGASTS